jgi:phage/plasmid-associated DNA primase
VQNGRIEIKRSGEIVFTRERGRPEDMQTDRIAINYNPEARATKTLEWLERIFDGRQEDVQAIGNIGGVCLYGSNLWKKLAVVWGGPNTGKTRIPELWSRLVPSRTLAIDTSRLGDRFELRRFCSRILLTQPDAPRNFMSLSCANVLKQLTGYDRIRAEGKGSDEDFYLRGDKMIVFTLNFDVLVKVDVDRKAWEERLVLLHADGKAYEGEEQNPHFVEDLFADEDEASGILNFALESVSKILQSKQWVRSEAQMHRLTKVMESSDSVANWAREAFEIEPKERETADHIGATVSEGWASYLRWCEMKNLEPWGEKTWREMAIDAVERVWFKTPSHDLPRGGTAQRGWRGLSLRV